MLYVFVFVFESANEDVSFSLEAPDLPAAVAKLAAELGTHDGAFYSKDPSDYHTDINDGKISVYTPRKLD
jgi:hypothetical protein